MRKSKFLVLVILSLTLLSLPAAGWAAPEEDAKIEQDFSQEGAEMISALPSIRLEEVLDGLVYPADIKHAGDGSGRLFIVEQKGRILILDGSTLLPTPFFDITADTECCGEKGLRSIAFHPDYATNGEFFILYSQKTADPDLPETRLMRYSVSADPDLADMTSGQIMLQLPQPYPNHNGGQLHFGPDGYLYVTLGDGGGAGDPGDRAQDLSNLFGTMLRLDVDSATPYAIPADNPFLEEPDDPDTLSEIWLYGFRNVWRFSFNPFTDDLIMADVGQNAAEEINYLAAGEPGGGNYGWRCYEGDLPYNLTGCGSIEDYIFPVLSYEHGELPCYSVTGGYVYQGNAIPGLVGKYLYGDYCSGKIWAADPDTGGNWTGQLLLDTDHKITTFGEDEAGELYLAHYNWSNGKLFKIVPDNTNHVGFYVPDSYRWYLKTDTSTGWSGVTSFGWGGASELQPVVGDWDGDGVDTAAFYKPSQWRWYLKNDQSDGWAGVTSFQWGGNAELIPVAGDWDGDGDDTVGFFKPSTSEWYLKDDNTGGWTGFTTVTFGGAAGNIPLTGDWDGDGDDTIGFFVPSKNKWWLKNDLVDGWVGVHGFYFGTTDPLDPVVGDWDSDGIDTVGGYVPARWRWFLKNDQDDGWSNVINFRYGVTAGYEVIAGDWQ